MEIAIICVNYNSYNSLSKYLMSIERSIKYEGSRTKITVFIADNSTNKQDFSSIYSGELPIKLFAFDNLGYFGGALGVYNRIKIDDYDYIIISNVDLILKEDFFSNLTDKNISDQYGWIAPTILSKQDKRDMNPKIVKRYSKRKMRILRAMYKYPFLKKLYLSTFYNRKRTYTTDNNKECDIYAGHGAMFIMTKTFVEKNPKLDYPVFLYGEEILALTYLINKYYE